ncbi:MAG: hypothetical protein P1P74_06220 [Desulfuromonadales bacterium]|nr:hypothetical protein [Desulfuromonadales bacterium]
MPTRQAGGQALGVLGGLDFNAGQGGTGLFRFDHPGGLTVNIQQVVGISIAGQRKLADGNTTTSVNINSTRILNKPSTSGQ